MKNRRRIFGIVIATILAIAGTVALVGYVQSAKNHAEAKEALVDVYVVNKVIPKGADAETVKSSVSIDKVPQRLMQPGAITNLSELGSKVTTVDLQPGDQLLLARLADKQQVDAELKDKVQISAQLTPERAVGGALAKGDTVGVYLSFPPFDTNVPSSDTTTPAKTANTSHLEFQHILVTNVQTTREPVTQDQNSGSNTNAGATQVVGSELVVTLALTPEQSERFVFATEFGHVWLSNEPATVADDGTKLITLGNAYAVVS
jgi:pilus assembly protein CpaB